MIIKIGKGYYQVIKGQDVILKTDFLGSGIAIGVLDKENEIAGLCHFVLPYQEYDIELNDGESILSGESLIPLFLEELKTQGVNFQSAQIVIAGGSVYKSNPPELNLAELNLKISKGLLKKFLISEENVIVKAKYNCEVCLEVNLKEKAIKIILNGKEEQV